jgi:uncharacterized protein (TIGR02246 family)
MARFSSLMILILALLLSAAAWAGPSEEAATVLDRWVQAFNSNDVDGLTALYDSDATLVGTLGPNLMRGREAIHVYYERLANSGDRVSIGERTLVALEDNVIYATGSYEFTTTRRAVRRTSLARFTMVLIKRGNDWLIAHHHSSRQRENLPPPPRKASDEDITLTQEEQRTAMHRG